MYSSSFAWKDRRIVIDADIVSGIILEQFPLEINQSKRRSAKLIMAIAITSPSNGIRAQSDQAEGNSKNTPNQEPEMEKLVTHCCCVRFSMLSGLHNTCSQLIVLNSSAGAFAVPEVCGLF